jgi:hypothetical protein
LSGLLPKPDLPDVATASILSLMSRIDWIHVQVRHDGNRATAGGQVEEIFWNNAAELFGLP